MAEYSVASLALLAGATAVAARRGVLAQRATWIGLAIFGVATILADLALTGLPIVTYDDSLRSGIGLGPMPIEDLLYGLALYLVAVAAWGRRAEATR